MHTKNKSGDTLIANYKKHNLKVLNSDKVIIEAPTILIGAFLLFFDISSWIVGSILIVLVLFKYNIMAESTFTEKVYPKNTIDTQEYKLTHKKNIENVIEHVDGYFEITIK